jgi:hypothetical protein
LSFKKTNNQLAFCFLILIKLFSLIFIHSGIVPGLSSTWKTTAQASGLAISRL